jgi:hypothetical protein
MYIRRTQTRSNATGEHYFTYRLVRPLSVGVEHIGLWAMRQVSFVDLLIEAGISGPLRAAILGVIIGRMDGGTGFRIGRTPLAGSA